MPVPTSISDLSTTAGSNPPSGSETPQEGDNHLRAAYSFIRQLSNRLDGTTQSDSPTFVDVTASGNVTASSSASSTVPRFRFSGDTDTGIGRSAADQVDVITNGTTKLSVTSDGRVYGSALHNNAGAVTGTTNQFIASGTYTATLTNVTNVANSSGGQSVWVRVGNVVTVSGTALIDPTAANTSTELGVSLPIASGFTATTDCLGVATTDNHPAGGDIGVASARVLADATNDRASIQFVSNDSLSAQSYSWTFQYEVK